VLFFLVEDILCCFFFEWKIFCTFFFRKDILCCWALAYAPWAHMPGHFNRPQGLIGPSPKSLLTYSSTMAAAEAGTPAIIVSTQKKKTQQLRFFYRGN
jgi:hypothetical protein